MAQSKPKEKIARRSSEPVRIGVIAQRFYTMPALQTRAKCG